MIAKAIASLLALLGSGEAQTLCEPATCEFNNLGATFHWAEISNPVNQQCTSNFPGGSCTSVASETLVYTYPPLDILNSYGVSITLSSTGYTYIDVAWGGSFANYNDNIFVLLTMVVPGNPQTIYAEVANLVTISPYIQGSCGADSSCTITESNSSAICDQLVSFDMSQQAIVAYQAPSSPTTHPLSPCQSVPVIYKCTSLSFFCEGYDPCQGQTYSISIPGLTVDTHFSLSSESLELTLEPINTNFHGNSFTATLNTSSGVSSGPFDVTVCALQFNGPSPSGSTTRIVGTGSYSFTIDHTILGPAAICGDFTFSMSVLHSPSPDPFTNIQCSSITSGCSFSFNTDVADPTLPGSSYEIEVISTSPDGEDHTHTYSFDMINCGTNEGLAIGTIDSNTGGNDPWIIDIDEYNGTPGATFSVNLASAEPACNVPVFSFEASDAGITITDASYIWGIDNEIYVDFKNRNTSLLTRVIQVLVTANYDGNSLSEPNKQFEYTEIVCNAVDPDFTDQRVNPSTEQIDPAVIFLDLADSSVPAVEFLECLNISPLCPQKSIELTGPGTENVLTDSDNISWLSLDPNLINDANGDFYESFIDVGSIADPAAVAGHYDGTFKRGWLSAAFKLTLCKVVEPFLSVDPDIFYIDLDEQLTEYTLDYTPGSLLPDETVCGSTIEHTISETGASPSAAHVDEVNNKIVFNVGSNPSEYPAGSQQDWTFAVNIVSQGSNAFEQIKPVKVVQCSQEAQEMVADSLIASEHSYRLPDNSGTWDENTFFEFEEIVSVEPVPCTIDQYVAKCIDPNGLTKTVFTDATAQVEFGTLCSRFQMETMLQQRKIGVPLSSFDPSHEGEYTFEFQGYKTGQPVGDFKITKIVNIQIDCNTASITPPSGPQTFIIQPPPGSDLGTAPVSYDDQVLYWSTNAATYDLTGEFFNSNPFSCTLQIELMLDQTLLNGTPETIAHPYSTFLSLSVDQLEAPQMQLVFTDYPNHDFTPTNEPQLVIEASFVEVGTVLSSISFEGHFMHDCRNIQLSDVYTGSSGTTIASDDRVGSEAILTFPIAQFPASHVTDSSCTVLGLELLHNTPSGLSSSYDSNLFTFNENFGPPSTAPELVAYASSNTVVKAYDSLSSTPSCSLEDLTTHECEVDFMVTVITKNGTVTTPLAESSVTFKSECELLSLATPEQVNSFWIDGPDLSLFSETYHVRDSRVIRLPSLAPFLPYSDPGGSAAYDQNYVYSKCGDMQYTLANNDNLPVTFENTLTGSFQDSSTLTIEITDSSYAVAPSYETVYTFDISGHYQLWQSQITYAYPSTFQLTVADYCIAITYSQFALQVRNPSSLYKTFDADANPHYFTKNLKSDPTEIQVPWIVYTPFLSKLPDDTGCGILVHEVTSHSYTSGDFSDLVLTSNGQLIQGQSGRRLQSVQAVEPVQDLPSPKGDYISWFIRAEEPEQIGIHTVQISYYPEDVPASPIQTYPLFTIEVLPCRVDTISFGEQQLPDLELDIGVSKVLPFQKFSQVPACEYEATYSLTLIESTQVGETAEFEESLEGQNLFATLNVDDGTLSFLPSGSTKVGSYAVFIRYFVSVNLEIQDPVVATYGPFTVTVTSDKKFNIPKTAVKIDNFTSYFEVWAGSSSQVLVGYPIDMQQDQFELVSQKTTPEYALDWIEVDQTNSKSSFQEGLFVTVSPPANSTETVFDLTLGFEEVGVEKPLNSTFVVTVKVLEANYTQASVFDQDRDQPVSFNATFKQENENDENSQLSQNATGFTGGFKIDDPSIKVQVHQSDIRGRFKVEFNRFIAVPKNMTSWTSKNEGAERIGIDLILSEETEELLEEQELKIDMSWSLLNAEVKEQRAYQRQLQDEEQDDQFVLEMKEMEVQLDFTIPELISQGFNDKDKIQVKMLPEMFTEELKVRPESDINLKDSKMVFEQDLQKQASSDLYDAIEAFKQTAKVMLFSFASSNLILSLVFAYLLQMLWSALNSLQIIVLTVLFNTLMPVNAQQVLIEVMQYVNLDIIETGWLLEKIMTLEELPRFTMLFEEVGYDTTNFIIELGPLFFIILGTILLLFIKVILKVSSRKCNENWFTRRVRAKVDITAGIIRFILEGCIELGLIAMICVATLANENFANFTESISIGSAFFTLACLCIAPLKLAYEAAKLRRLPKQEPNKQEEPNQEASQQTTTVAPEQEETGKVEGKKAVNPYVQFFELYKTDRASMSYVLIFFLRRYLLVLIVVLLPIQRKFQISAQIFLTLVTMAYLICVKPYKDWRLTLQESINEGFTLLAAYPLLTFTMWVPDAQRRIETGWVLLGCIIFVLVFNIGLIVIVAARDIYRKLRLKYLRKKHGQLVAALQKKKEAQRTLLFDADGNRICGTGPIKEAANATGSKKQSKQKRRKAKKPIIEDSNAQVSKPEVDDGASNVAVDGKQKEVLVENDAIDDLFRLKKSPPTKLSQVEDLNASATQLLPARKLKLSEERLIKISKLKQDFQEFTAELESAQKLNQVGASETEKQPLDETTKSLKLKTVQPWMPIRSILKNSGQQQRAAIASSSTKTPVTMLEQDSHGTPMARSFAYQASEIDLNDTAQQPLRQDRNIIGNRGNGLTQIAPSINDDYLLFEAPRRSAQLPPLRTSLAPIVRSQLNSYQEIEEIPSFNRRLPSKKGKKRPTNSQVRNDMAN